MTLANFSSFGEFPNEISALRVAGGEICAQLHINIQYAGDMLQRANAEASKQLDKAELRAEERRQNIALMGKKAYSDHLRGYDCVFKV